MSIRAILLFTFILGSLPICFVRPFYGILVWIVVAFLNPQAFVWEWGSSFPWALAVAIPTIVGAFIFTRDWGQRLASREVLLLVLLWIWFSITTFASMHTPMFMHHAMDTYNQWKLVSKILVMTVLTVAVVDGFARLRTMVLVIVGSFGFYVAKAFPFMIATGGTFRIYGPAQSMIADNNDFGLALNMTLPLFFFLALSEKSPWLKNVFRFLFVITIPAILFTYSRGALVGLLAVLAVLFFEFKRRLVLAPVLVLGALLAVTFAPQSWKDRMNPNSDTILDRSAEGRLNAWRFSWNLALDYPIAGGGFETFSSELFDRYAPDARDWHGPHSVYFQILAEHGFVGLGLFLTLVFSCFATAHRLIVTARRDGDELIINYAKMFRIGIVGFLTSGLFLGRGYFDYFYALVACVAILRRTYFAELREAEYAEPGPAESEEAVPA